MPSKRRGMSSRICVYGTFLRGRLGLELIQGVVRGSYDLHSLSGIFNCFTREKWYLFLSEDSLKHLKRPPVDQAPLLFHWRQLKDYILWGSRLREALRPVLRCSKSTLSSVGCSCNGTPDSRCEVGPIILSFARYTRHGEGLAYRT